MSSTGQYKLQQTCKLILQEEKSDASPLNKFVRWRVAASVMLGFVNPYQQTSEQL